MWRKKLTASTPELVEAFFTVMSVMSIKYLGVVHEFIGLHPGLYESGGFTRDQQAAIEKLLEQYEIADANDVRPPIEE
jgi:hypothetical protein